MGTVTLVVSCRVTDLPELTLNVSNVKWGLCKSPFLQLQGQGHLSHPLVQIGALYSLTSG